MKRIAAMVLAALVVACCVAIAPGEAPAAEPPADRVLAMYFHRTKRCPTCQKMGSYSEEAVKRGFAKQIKAGTVAFYYVDFQDQRNAPITKAYGISGPTLVVAKVAENKVAEYKNLDEIWSKVDDKEEFLKYVQKNVTAYCK